MLSRFNRIPERYGRTNGQTDGRTENCCINTRVNLLTRDKKGSRDPNDATFGGKFLFMGYIFEACTLKNSDLEIWVSAHSRSLKSIPFESLDVVSYLYSNYDHL